jgi:trk system potassium uptake protein TrkA
MKQVCVIGLGQYGSHLARTLVRMGCEVLAMDIRNDRVEAIRDDVHRAIIGDARLASTVSAALTHSVQEAIVALGEDSIEPSILCTLNLARQKVPTIRCTAVSDEHAEILAAVGAHDIIFPERESAERTSRRVANPNLRDMFSLSEDFRIIELVVPKKFAGRSLSEIGLRNEFDALILAIKPAGEDTAFSFLPTADTVIHANETLMVLGRELDLARLASLD